MLFHKQKKFLGLQHYQIFNSRKFFFGGGGAGGGKENSTYLSRNPGYAPEI